VTLKLCVVFFVQNIALDFRLNPLNAKLNPICHLLALLGAHHILHVSRIRVKADLTLLLYNARDVWHITCRLCGV
jgi:hypothetical protein